MTQATMVCREDIPIQPREHDRYTYMKGNPSILTRSLDSNQ